MRATVTVRRTTIERGLLFAAICAAPFMVVLDSNIVTVALPSLGGDLGFSAQTLQWVITAFALTFGGFLLVGGRAGDLYGRRRLLRVGLALFSLASLAGALAQSPAMLISTRALQGLGAALAFPASVALVTSTFEEGPERNRALGVYGTAVSAAFLAGVTLGGVLTDLLGWRAVLLVNVPLGALAILISPHVVPESRRPDRASGLDLPGALAATAALLALMYGLTQADAEGWLSVPTLTVLALAGALASVAVAIERNSRAPLMTAALLRRRPMGAAVAAAMMAVGSGAGVMFVLTLYLQEILGYGAFESGLALSFLGMSGVAAGIVTPKLAARFGVVPVLAMGVLVQAAGILVMVPMGTAGGLDLVVLGTTVMGFGHFGATVMFLSLATTGVPAADQGVTAGWVNSAQQVGAGLGLAIIVAVASGRTEAVAVGTVNAAATVTGFQWGLAAGALLSALAAPVVWAVAGGVRDRTHLTPAPERRGQ